MHQTAKRSLGVLFWLLLGCSPAEGDGTRQPTTQGTVDESSGTTDAINDSVGPNPSANNARGGTTSTSTPPGNAVSGSTSRVSVGGANPASSSGGVGIAGATAEEPLSSGGSTGSGGTETLGQGGDMSAVGGARPPTDSTGGTGGSAGAASTAGAAGQAQATFEQVLARFCELRDVLDCNAQCLDVRQAEADWYAKCREFYRLLMACQIELAAAQRVCGAKIVTSPNHCTRENTAYTACVTAPAS